MDPITLTIAGVGALASGAGLFSGWKSAKDAKKEQEKLQREQRARNEAWYARNYFQDYLNSTDAQNALRRAKEARDEHSRQLRARAAISGATPEQVERAEQAGAEVVGNTIANLAAQGSAIKREVDRQKQAMDADLNAQEQAMVAQEQAAGENLMANSANLLGSSLMMGAGAFADKGAATAKSSTATSTSTATQAADTTPAITAQTLTQANGDMLARQDADYIQSQMTLPTGSAKETTPMYDSRPWYERLFSKKQ